MPMAAATNAFGVVGASGSGKTTLIERLIPVFLRSSRTVATIKLTHHDLDMDQNGKDSRRHRLAGAGAVALIGPKRTHIIHEASLDLSHALDHFASFDLVLIEGFIDAQIPKLEVYRPALGKPFRYPGKPMVCAIATDSPESIQDMPELDLNNPDNIADFILSQLGISA